MQDVATYMRCTFELTGLLDSLTSATPHQYYWQKFAIKLPLILVT